MKGWWECRGVEVCRYEFSIYSKKEIHHFPSRSDSRFSTTTVFTEPSTNLQYPHLIPSFCHEALRKETIVSLIPYQFHQIQTPFPY